MVFAVGILALFGHMAVCIALVNRMHAIGLTQLWLRVCDVCWYSFSVGVPLGICYLYVVHGLFTTPLINHPLVWLAILYMTFAICAAIGAVWFRFSLSFSLRKPTHHLVSNHTEYVSLAKITGQRLTGDRTTALLAKIPRNEILDLSIHCKNVVLPRLDPALEGMTITHLTDLHFTGQLDKEFFAEVVRQSNQLNSDLVVLTGDIIDKPRCIEWIPEILGKLNTGRLGAYFVLGNHDKRVKDEALVRRKLVEAGLIDMGCGNRLMLEHAGRPILLAGNELPWHGPATDLSDAPIKHNGVRPLRIALTHTPDKLRWAQDNDIDLMLAGHTHGGQIRFPWIGPVLSPSLYGVRHASGTFMHEPTLLHVSRGISGTRPLRFNCPPELAQLILRTSTEL